MKAKRKYLGKAAALLSILFIATMFFVLYQTAEQAAAQDDVKLEAEKKKNAEFVLKLAYTDAANWPESGIKPLGEHAFALIFRASWNHAPTAACLSNSSRPHQWDRARKSSKWSRREHWKWGYRPVHWQEYTHRYR